MHSKGKRICIPYVEDYSDSYSRYSKVDFELKDRPSKTIKRIIKIGIERGWFEDKEIFEELLLLGFDNGYISDAFLLAFITKYFFKDMNWSKKQRLKELNGNGTKIRD